MVRQNARDVAAIMIIIGVTMGKKGLRRPPGVIITFGDYDLLCTGVIIDA
jgi:hypothetical protein